jgi:class 3 adenylate cyclase
MLASTDRPGRPPRISVQLSSIDVIASALDLEPALPDLGGMSSPDGALTLMVSDIGNAESVETRLGPDQWAQLLRDHQVLVAQVVAHHGGEVIRVERDGFMASFNSAHGGLRCAIELQRTLSSDSEEAVKIRMGLNSGFVIAHPEQPLGRNVVLAARIAAHATGGEILTSSALKEYTERDPSFRFEPRGEFHFKGMVGEHTVYSVRWQHETS